MKKLSLFLVLIAGIFFMNINDVKAIIEGDYELECTDPDSTGKYSCKIGFTVTDKSYNYNRVKITFKLINVSFGVDDIELEDDWYLSSYEGNVYVFDTTDYNFKVGYHKIATITMYKDLSKTNCTESHSYEFSKVNRSCTTVDDLYFGKNNSSVSKETYEEECFKHFCEEVNGNYYGKNGSKVNEERYKEECLEEEKHYCTYEEKENKYYGSNGEEVEKEVYEEECFVHVCEEVNDKYYDEEGNITDKSTYEKYCKEHKCEIVDNDYFDSDGNIVNEEEYNESCFLKEVIICDFKDDNYYDNNGNIVTKEEFDKVCFKHPCEVIDGIYYDNEGNIVDADTYNKYCVIADNPQTGLLIPLISLGVLISGYLGIRLYTKKNNKIY